ncbi:MAG TPA: hypothetical protein DCQ68_07635 [Chryseobacterium indologenes]|nr:hypothetical protein [Chryseobacterium indologenes]
MKKYLSVAALSLIGLISCSNEQNILTSVESMKTPEVEAFDKAFKSLGDPKNQPTAEEKQGNSVELSDRRKEIILPSSKALIVSTGVSEAEMNRKTGGDKNQIIAWALDISFKQKEQIYKTVKIAN